MAGTATVASAVRGVLHGAGSTVIKRKVSFVADASDGSYPDATVSDVGGFIACVYVDPGAVVTPTTGLDLTVKMDGIDLLGGAGADIATAADAIITPANTAGDAYYPAFAGDLTVSLSGNSENSATVDVYLMIIP